MKSPVAGHSLAQASRPAGFSVLHEAARMDRQGAESMVTPALWAFQQGNHRPDIPAAPSTWRS